MRRPSPFARASDLVRVACLVATLSGCGDEYEVRLSFADEAVRLSAQRVEVALVRDCTSQELGTEAVRPVVEVEFLVGESAPALGSVSAGDYGLYARAINERCEVNAAGCTPVRVDPGSETRLSVVLRSIDISLCEPAACTGGRCADGDAGAVDAGDGSVDAFSDALVEVSTDGMVDASTDGFVDAPTDVPSDVPSDSPNDVPSDVPTDAFRCATLATAQGWEACREVAGRCEIVFMDGAGCAAVCAAFGMECRDSYDNQSDMCAPTLTIPLACAPSGLASAYCICGP